MLLRKKFGKNSRNCYNSIHLITLSSASEKDQSIVSSRSSVSNLGLIFQGYFVANVSTTSPMDTLMSLRIGHVFQSPLLHYRPAIPLQLPQLNWSLSFTKCQWHDHAPLSVELLVYLGTVLQSNLPNLSCPNA